MDTFSSVILQLRRASSMYRDLAPYHQAQVRESAAVAAWAIRRGDFQTAANAAWDARHIADRGLVERRLGLA